MTGARWFVVLAALAACRGGGSKSKRTGSAAPVEVITEPRVPETASGAGVTADEIEPNDGEEVASPIPLGGTARGKIEPEADVDFYRLDVDRAGVLQVALSGIERVDLTLELLDGTGTSLGKSERVGTRIKEGIPNAGVSAGRYTLVVKHAPKKKVRRRKKGRKAPAVEAAPPPAPVYELTAQLISVPLGAEREPNGDRGTANDLIVAENVTGYLGWADDRDVWKLSVETLSEKNTVDIEVSAIEGMVLSLEITDGVGQVLATRKAPRGQPLIVRGLLPVLPEGAPPFHYLALTGDKSNPETAYTLHASAQVIGPDPELEPNDIVDKAQPIPADRTVVHASWTPGDIDCFAVAMSESDRLLDVTIDTPAELDLTAELLVDGKPTATANKGGKGVPEKLSAQVPAGAVVVVRVKSAAANATVEAKYDVSVLETTEMNDNAP